MTSFKYDLAIAYRIYPKSSANPSPIFREDKFKLAELCLRSFKRSLGSLKVKLWVLLNDCPKIYEKLFTDLWNAEDLILLRYPGISQGGTLQEQVRIMLEQTDAEFIYLAEDDYFYLPDQFQSAIDFLRRNRDADFVSPYDHRDLYTLELHNVPRERCIVNGRTWRSSLSTTHTFLARMSSFKESRRAFESLRPGVNFDLAMWMALTKQRVFNPVIFLRWIIMRKKFWAGSIVLSWWYFGRQIIFGKRRTLWIPTPAIATHMIAGLESPGIDWQKEFAKATSLSFSANQDSILNPREANQT